MDVRSPSPTEQSPAHGRKFFSHGAFPYSETGKRSVSAFVIANDSVAEALGSSQLNCVFAHSPSAVAHTIINPRTIAYQDTDGRHQWPHPKKRLADPHQKTKLPPTSDKPKGNNQADGTDVLSM